MNRSWKALVLLLGCALLFWAFVHAQVPAIVPPFASTPFITSYLNSGMVVYGRHLNGTYDNVTVSRSPYTLLTGAAAVMGYVSEGLNALMAAPGGPPNVGRASQMFGGGKFSSSGTPGVAYLTFSATSSVFVGLASPSLAYTGTTTYPVGPYVVGLVTGDFNGDSVLDIAVTYQNGVAILLNKGDGTFNPQVTYTAGMQPSGLSAFDVNHDNILDLVVTDGASSSVYVLTGNGNGTFNAAVPYSTASSGGNSITVADFDGDGNPDLAVASGYTSGGNISILLGNGNGTFHAGPITAVSGSSTFISAGDFNGDGKLDLATVDTYGQTVTMFLGTGGGNFQRKSSYITSAIPDALVLTDFNHDGILDVLVAAGDARVFGANKDSGNIDVLLGNGDGTFQGAIIANTGGSTAGGTALTVSDFNGDGVLDVIVNNHNQGSLFLLPGAGNGAFQAPTTINLGSGKQPNALASGDFNGDGKADVAVAEASTNGTVDILLNSSAGFQAPSSFASGGSTPSAIVAADFDGDGKLDLAVANSASGNTTIFHGGGNGTFQLLRTYATGTNPQSIAVSDLNGDGLPDLIVADSGQQFNTPAVPGGLYVVINQGSGNFQAPVPYTTGDFPITVVAGDVNGDGILDIITTAGGANVTWNVDVLLGNGNGTFGPATNIPTEFGATMPVVRDFNGDGKVDIVVAHCCGDTDMTYLQGNGNGTFQAEVEFNGGPSPYAALAADLNQDGSPDLVILGNNGGVVGLLNTTPAANFPCQLSSTVLQPSAAGGNVTVTINSGSCGLGVANVPSWITVASTSASGVTLTVAANTGGARSANISIGSVSVTVNQAAPPACSYLLSDGGEGFAAAGGNGSVNILVNSGCPWTATSPPSWITFTSGASGSGAATFTFQASANSGGARSGSFTLAGISFNVQQEAASISGLSFVGSMAHLAAEENWTTTFTLVNKSASAATARLSFAGDALDPTGNGALALPLVFPQQSGAAGPLLAASFDQALAANASLIVATGGPQTPPVLVGSAQLSATGTVDGFAIFHQIVTTQEAVVPMETRNASSYLLAFDNTNGLVLGVAVENVSAQNAVIPVTIRDDTGAAISSPGTTISLGGNGHTSFVLSTQFPITANIRGTIEFDTPAGGQISVLGLRFTPPNNALTTIPALANVGTGGGSIAHLASGGDGWQTTFVLVNTGTSSAPATLSFFNDQTGLPLSLPLTFPQGNIADTTAPSITQTMSVGATLIAVSSGAPTLLTGSAQLSTSGHVSGFVIFRHNGQEAVVPLESRNANAYIVAFDNTNGTATGVAVNSVSAQAVNIPVVVRDDLGNQLATDTIAMAANGHYAFTMGVDRYPAALTIRGTIEFDKPAGAQIGALGIRIPPGAAHTYTTLPVLAK